MSGSKKGRKLREYRTARRAAEASGGYAHVLLRTPQQAAEDERENAPTTREMLDWPAALPEGTTP